MRRRNCMTVCTLPPACRIEYNVMEHRSDVEIHGQESCEETIFILDWLFLKQLGRYCRKDGGRWSQFNSGYEYYNVLLSWMPC